MTHRDLAGSHSRPDHAAERCSCVGRPVEALPFSVRLAIVILKAIRTSQQCYELTSAVYKVLEDTVEERR